MKKLLFLLSFVLSFSANSDTAYGLGASSLLNTTVVHNNGEGGPEVDVIITCSWRGRYNHEFTENIEGEEYVFIQSLYCVNWKMRNRNLRVVPEHQLIIEREYTERVRLEKLNGTYDHNDPKNITATYDVALPVKCNWEGVRKFCNAENILGDVFLFEYSLSCHGDIGVMKSYYHNSEFKMVLIDDVIEIDQECL